MGRIQYGVIGCGEHALQTHAIPNKDTAELELAGVYDISSERMANFAAKTGLAVQEFTSREELLGSYVSAVLIGTPDEFHLDDLAAAVRAGKHAFVEKPLAVNLGQLAALQDVLVEVGEKELVVSSCHPRRYDPPYTWLKDNLLGLRERLGEPLQVKFDFRTTSLNVSGNTIEAFCWITPTTR